MTIINPAVQGFVPEPESSKHWSYEEHLAGSFIPYQSSDNAIDLRQYTSPRHNQITTNSCVAQSVVKALEIKRIMKHGRDAHSDLSVLSVYYLSRELMNPSNVDKDMGTFVSLACDVLRRFGVCEETDWPFDKNKIFVPPPWKAMRRAYKNKITSFYRINSKGQDRVEAIITALTAGNPVVYGTAVDKSWYSYNSGEVLKPVAEPLGYHATVLLGWDGSNFIGENSWGTLWGDNGFYKMSPDVISGKNSADFWIIQAGWEDWDV